MSGRNERYETIVIFDPSVTEGDLSAQIEKIEGVIKAHDGVVERKDQWGLRHLAYKINKKEQGIYVVFVHTGANTLIADLRRQLRINDSVLRFLTVHKDKYAPDMLRPPADHHDSYRGEGGGFREGGYRDRDGGGYRDRDGGGYRGDRGEGGFRREEPRQESEQSGEELPPQ